MAAARRCIAGASDWPTPSRRGANVSSVESRSTRSRERRGRCGTDTLTPEVVGATDRAIPIDFTRGSDRGSTPPKRATSRSVRRTDRLLAWNNEARIIPLLQSDHRRCSTSCTSVPLTIVNCRKVFSSSTSSRARRPRLSGHGRSTCRQFKVDLLAVTTSTPSQRWRARDHRYPHLGVDGESDRTSNQVTLTSIRTGCALRTARRRHAVDGGDRCDWADRYRSTFSGKELQSVAPNKPTAMGTVERYNRAQRLESSPSASAAASAKASPSGKIFIDYLRNAARCDGDGAYRSGARRAPCHAAAVEALSARRTQAGRWTWRTIERVSGHRRRGITVRSVTLAAATLQKLGIDLRAPLAYERRLRVRLPPAVAASALAVARITALSGAALCDALRGRARGRVEQKATVPGPANDGRPGFTTTSISTAISGRSA